MGGGGATAMNAVSRADVRVPCLLGMAVYRIANLFVASAALHSDKNGRWRLSGARQGIKKYSKLAALQCTAERRPAMQAAAWRIRGTMGGR